MDTIHFQKKWNRLDDDTQAKVKKFNSDLRKKRKQSGENGIRDANNDDRSVTQRNQEISGANDDNPSPTKKLRSVGFKDS